MGKKVVILASGETERRSLPHLLAALEREGVAVVEIRIPPANRALTVEMAERLLKASWFENVTAPADKFVVLVDTDAKSEEEALRPFREQLASRMGPKIQAHLQFACARRHLEAWYFADSAGLQSRLGRDLGGIDPTKPEEIQNPKLHLKHLLGERAYTAVISEEIARHLNPETIRQRSPSFRGFLEAVRNGKASPSENPPRS